MRQQQDRVRDHRLGGLGGELVEQRLRDIGITGDQLAPVGNQTRVPQCVGDRPVSQAHGLDGKRRFGLSGR